MNLRYNRCVGQDKQCFMVLISELLHIRETSDFNKNTVFNEQFYFFITM